jgi:ketosteroid isomerase-like protein
MKKDTLSLAPRAHAAEAALQAWHRALESHDWAAVVAGLSAEFLMIEHERILDKAALLALLMSSAKRGRQRASLHGFRTVAQHDVAWTTVRNDEIWIANDGAQTPYSFLETAVFRREGGVWRIDRYHATRLDN